MFVICGTCHGAGEDPNNPAQRCPKCSGYGGHPGETKPGEFIHFKSPPIELSVEHLLDAYGYMRAGPTEAELHHTYPAKRRIMVGPHDVQPAVEEHELTRGFVLGVLSGVLAEREESKGRGAELLNALLSCPLGTAVIAPEGLFIEDPEAQEVGSARVHVFKSGTMVQWRDAVKTLVRET